MIIKQKGDEVVGIFGYYFRDGYKSIYIRGKYNKKTRQFVVRSIPLTYFRAASVDGVDCMMDFYGTIIISRTSTTIKGLFATNPQYSYTCPEVKVGYVLDAGEKMQDSIIQNRVARKLWQPQQQDVVVNNGVLPSGTVAGDDSVKITQAELQNLVQSFEKRETVLARELEIDSDSVRISFYDNGEIDGDSISVFLNKVPLLTGQSLTAQALNIYLSLDSTKGVTEISMFAENLGKYPPNTALMVINDGEHRYEVYLSSSLTQNSQVRLKRKKK